jgi:hypothetical protein
MTAMFSLIALFLIGVATAYFANQRGRDPYIWFAIGIFLGLIGLILLMVLPPLTEGTENSKNSAAQSLPSSSVILEATPPMLTEAPKHDYLIKDWFYFDKASQQQGPITFDALKALWLEEKINPLSFVWSEGMDQWRKIGELDELSKALQS